MSKPIGELLKEYRKKEDLSIQRLSEITGLSPSYISQIENGKRNPSEDVLMKILEGLKLPSDILDFQSNGEKIVFDEVKIPRNSMARVLYGSAIKDGESDIIFEKDNIKVFIDVKTAFKKSDAIENLETYKNIYRVSQNAVRKGFLEFMNDHEDVLYKYIAKNINETKEDIYKQLTIFDFMLGKDIEPGDDNDNN